jgi:hypothetical protein
VRRCPPVTAVVDVMSLVITAGDGGVLGIVDPHDVGQRRPDGR